MLLFDGPLIRSGVISGALLYIRDDFSSVDKKTWLQVMNTSVSFQFSFFFVSLVSKMISALCFSLLFYEANCFIQRILQKLVVCNLLYMPSLTLIRVCRSVNFVSHC